MPSERSNNGSLSPTKVGILQEYAVMESTNGILSAEVARLKDQVEAARARLRNTWDFIFRLKTKHAAELARLEAELTTSGLPKLRAALVDLQRQNNALRLENAEQKQAWERMSAELVKRKAETIQLARERDAVRSKIAHRLTSKAVAFKKTI
jgi:hypothetical protein